MLNKLKELLQRWLGIDIVSKAVVKVDRRQTQLLDMHRKSRKAVQEDLTGIRRDLENAGLREGESTRQLTAALTMLSIWRKASPQFQKAIDKHNATMRMKAKNAAEQHAAEEQPATEPMASPEHLAADKYLGRLNLAAGDMTEEEHAKAAENLIKAREHASDVSDDELDHEFRESVHADGG